MFFFLAKMKKSINILSLFCLLLFAQANAQDKIVLGVSITPEFTGQTAAIYSEMKTKPSLGYTAGMQVDLLPFRNFGFFAGLNYFQKNIKYGLRDIRVNDEDAEVVQLEKNNNYLKKSLKENYLEGTAGIIIRSNPGKLNLYTNLGIAYSLLLNQYDPFSSNEYSRSQLESFNFNTNLVNGLAGVGVQLPLNKRFRVQVEARMRYGFTPMIAKEKLPSRDQIFFNDAHTITAGLKLGLTYALIHKL